ncbi:MAG: AAA family ATPase [Clostridia bacterium]|nr:AAA family ATPase [Clostridia bacterium]
MACKRNIMLAAAIMCLAGAGLVAFAGQMPAYTPRAMLAAAVLLGIVYFYFGGRGTVSVSEGGGFLDARKPGANISFNDVAANAEAVRSLRELVEYINDPGKFNRLGARMPRGVLLYGPPGTGKTLLARALAGEAGVPIFAMSGSDFVQMYAGVGASRVRALFKKARKCGKCVIFIDEIDAVGKKRQDMSSDERDQTLNALLSEMSGFDPADGTIVIAATNRIDALDEALLRPGRFDRHIEVALPSRDERLEILKLHLKNKPANGDIDVEALAAQTVSFSGASLGSMINEAAIRAASRGQAQICQQDLQRAFITTIAGSDKPSISTRKELAVIAVHEAGHALASRLTLPEDRIMRVTVLPTSKGMAGYNLSIPVQSAVTDKERLLNQIGVLLAGRAAEMLIGGENALTSGAMNDLSKAAELASAMVMDLGMASKPCLSMRQLYKSTGINDQQTLSNCVKLLDEQFERVTRLLADNVTALMAICEALMEFETIDENKLNEIMKNTMAAAV